MIIFWGGISAFIAITGKGVEPSELHNRISVAPFFFYMILALPVAVAWNLTIGFVIRSNLGCILPRVPAIIVRTGDGARGRGRPSHHD